MAENNKNMQLIGGIVVIIVVIAIGAYALTSGSAPSGSTTSISQSGSTVPTQTYSNPHPIKLTDPAQLGYRAYSCYS